MFSVGIIQGFGESQSTAETVPSRFDCEHSIIISHRPTPRENFAPESGVNSGEIKNKAWPDYGLPWSKPKKFTTSGDMGSFPLALHQFRQRTQADW